MIDSGNKRIVILDRQFNYTKELKLPKSERESEKEFTDIAINDKGDIYISGSYLYDSGLYRYNLEKDKFENVQKYFYGSLGYMLISKKKRLQAEQDLMLFGNLMEEI